MTGLWQRGVGYALVLAVAVAVAGVASVQGAQAGRSAQPGVYVSQGAMDVMMEHLFDHASCLGIWRFGFRAGKYVMFDCKVSMSGTVCTSRVKAVVPKRRGPLPFIPEVQKVPKLHCDLG